MTFSTEMRMRKVIWGDPEFKWAENVIVHGRMIKLAQKRVDVHETEWRGQEQMAAGGMFVWVWWLTGEAQKNLGLGRQVGRSQSIRKVDSIFVSKERLTNQTSATWNDMGPEQAQATGWVMLCAKYIFVGISNSGHWQSYFYSWAANTKLWILGN